MGGRLVLFLSYSGVLGGAERVLLDCATRLERPAALACPEGPLASAARAAGLDVHPLPDRSLRMRGARGAALRGLAGLARDARRLTRELQPAAVAAWGARAVLAAAAVPLPAPVLAVHHDLPPSPGVGAVVRAASRRAAGAIATSEAVARELGGAAAVLRPGVDLAAFSPTPPPAGPPRALVLGALVPWKRADLALEVAALVPELTLTVAGAPLPGDDGAFAAQLRRRAAEPDLRGRVELPGPLEDPGAALAGVHVLLHCADAEPYGMVLVEALASGRPVVAPAAAGPLEIVTDGAGRLYPPGDAAAAAAALRAVLADPDAPARARRLAESRFSVEDSAARFERALEAVAR